MRRDVDCAMRVRERERFVEVEWSSRRAVPCSEVRGEEPRRKSRRESMAGRVRGGGREGQRKGRRCR